MGHSTALSPADRVWARETYRRTHASQGDPELGEPHDQERRRRGGAGVGHHREDDDGCEGFCGEGAGEVDRR
jgi:hypothetical protein